MNKNKPTNAVYFPELDELENDIPEDSKYFIDFSMEICEYVHHLIASKKLNQKIVAERLGKSEAEVSRMLKTGHNITLRTISKLCAALETKIIEVPQVCEFDQSKGALMTRVVPQSNINWNPNLHSVNVYHHPHAGQSIDELALPA